MNCKLHADETNFLQGVRQTFQRYFTKYPGNYETIDLEFHALWKDNDRHLELHFLFNLDLSIYLSIHFRFFSSRFLNVMTYNLTCNRFEGEMAIEEKAWQVSCARNTNASVEPRWSSRKFDGVINQCPREISRQYLLKSGVAAPSATNRSLVTVITAFHRQYTSRLSR